MGSSSELAPLALALMLALLAVVVVVLWVLVIRLAADVTQLQRDLATSRGTVDALAYDVRRLRVEHGGA
jgi:hypothetical protein